MGWCKCLETKNVVVVQHCECTKYHSNFHLIMLINFTLIKKNPAKTKLNYSESKDKLEKNLHAYNIHLPYLLSW